MPCIMLPSYRAKPSLFLEDSQMKLRLIVQVARGKSGDEGRQLHCCHHSHHPGWLQAAHPCSCEGACTVLCHAPPHGPGVYLQTQDSTVVANLLRNSAPCHVCTHVRWMPHYDLHLSRIIVEYPSLSIVHTTFPTKSASQ